MLKIVSDSSMDMPAGWEKKYEINILPINIQFGTRLIDKELIFPTEKFYQMVKEYKDHSSYIITFSQSDCGILPKNSKKGESILSLHVASKMSGTYDAVQLAARELTGELDIYPFDSGNGSAGLAFMCREARDDIPKGGETIQGNYSPVGRD